MFLRETYEVYSQVDSLSCLENKRFYERNRKEKKKPQEMISYFPVHCLFLSYKEQDKQEV